jgi:peptide/nickel transport system substrate-binding protein
MDVLIDGARAAAGNGDTATYDKDVKAFITKAYTEAPRIPLFQPYLNVALQKSISGYTYWFHRQLDYRSLAKA